MMAKKRKHRPFSLPLAPVGVSQNCWFYEERGGLTIVIRGEVVSGCQFHRIPWRFILSAAAHYRRYRAGHKAVALARKAR